MKNKLISQIENYQPFNTQEELDRQTILYFLNNFSDIFYRDNLIAHMTASCWLVNENFDQVVMAYHNLYDSYSWLGGHSDGNMDLLQVAIKEAKEESGLNDISVVSKQIFSIEVLAVDHHFKKGKFVPAHLHLNLTYLLQADSVQPLKIKQDENSKIDWFSLDEAVEICKEEPFKQHIYPKLNQKLAIFLKERRL
ncbi:MAG: NUDIX hydrolase [Erysipelotrichaceae bacterium]